MQPDTLYNTLAALMVELEERHHGEAWFLRRQGVNLGLLPSFIKDTDPRPVREQIDERYAHGGGWMPFPGFSLSHTCELIYPGDPPMSMLAISRLRDEIIVFYENSWLLVIQPTEEWEVSRVD